MSEWFGTFHFLRPEWLWALAAVPVIYFAYRVRDDVREQWKKVIDPSLLDHLVIQKTGGWRIRPIHMICFGILLGIIGAAGPSWRREKPPFTEDKAPLVIAMDLSETMDAIDVDPSRLERAKLKVKDLLKLREGSRTALIAYAGTAHTVVPLTTDRGLLELYLDSLSTSLMPRKGKNTAQALSEVGKVLEHEPTPGSVVLLTDGVEPSAVSALHQLTGQGKNNLLVLGIGTASGGPVKTGTNTYLTNASGSRVFAKLDVGAMKSLKSSGIPTSIATLDDSDIEWVQRNVQNHLQLVQEQNTQLRWIDDGYWLVIPCVILALTWFRKGWLVRWASSAAMMVLIVPGPAAVTATFRFIDLWLTPDQQGRYYYEHDEFASAAERFEDPMWKGMSFARAGDYTNALTQFSLTDTPESWYDQGNALAHLKKYPEAVEAYQQALARRHPWPEAEQNLTLVRSLIPPKKNEKDEEQELPPDMKPDEMKFDEKGKKGKKAQIQALRMDPAKMADIWMRNIQTSPADFLRRRFAIQAEGNRHP